MSIMIGPKKDQTETKKSKAETSEGKKTKK